MPMTLPLETPQRNSLGMDRSSLQGSGPWNRCIDPIHPSPPEVCVGGQVLQGVQTTMAGLQLRAQVSPTGAGGTQGSNGKAWHPGKQVGRCDVCWQVWCLIVVIGVIWHVFVIVLKWYIVIYVIYSFSYNIVIHRIGIKHATTLG